MNVIYVKNQTKKPNIKCVVCTNPPNLEWDKSEDRDELRWEEGDDLTPDKIEGSLRCPSCTKTYWIGG